MIILIAAMAQKRVIGYRNRLPWHLPEDLKHFKEKTMGHPILMGRKTFEAIGRPLPGRRNLILTRSFGYHAEGVMAYHSVDDVLRTYEKENLFVIGGEEIFHLFLPYAQWIDLTYIDHPFPGDRFFPQLVPGEWRLISREKGKKNKKNPYDYEFLLLKRAKEKNLLTLSPDRSPLKDRDVSPASSVATPRGATPESAHDGR